MIFQKKISLGFHILIKQYPMVAAKRSAGTPDDRSGKPRKAREKKWRK